LVFVSDEKLFEEVAERLKRMYERDFGSEFIFGCFEFVFHNGVFRGIEERPRNKRYWSRKRLEVERQSEPTVERGE
jgi:hypothetical protein